MQQSKEQDKQSRNNMKPTNTSALQNRLGTQVEVSASVINERYTSYLQRG